jgi:hypothetical protein
MEAFLGLIFGVASNDQQQIFGEVDLREEKEKEEKEKEEREAVPEPLLPPWRDGTASTPPPPAAPALDLRRCRSCKEVGYLRKGGCCNMDCVS